MSSGKSYDLVIIGAGPSALTAGLYASRENLKTLLIEKQIAGGLMTTTDWVDNYPGFPDGISGFDLAELMKKQTERFGGEIISGVVDNIVTSRTALHKIKLLSGKEFEARAILIASGSQPRKLGLPDEEKYQGRGVHYCATCDGAFYNKKTVAVIGGGNSAVQEAIFLTKFAKKIIIFSASELTASSVLQKNLQPFLDSGQIQLKTQSLAKRLIIEKDKVVGLEFEQSGKKGKEAVDGIFIFIGLIPNTSFLVGGEVKVDYAGFVITNEKLMTSVPGIFASGDVRSGSIKQIVSAAGEGAEVALSISQYLEK